MIDFPTLNREVIQKKEMEFAMQQQPTIMKKNNFQKAEDLRMLPTYSRSLYTSQPHPAADYAEAVQRVENKIATEVDFYPGSHTLLMTHGARTAKSAAGY